MSDLPAIPYGSDPAGAPLSVVLIHGRDRTPDEMIGIAEQIGMPELAWRALQAPGGSWYPGVFMDPIEVNQPRVDQALRRVGAEVRALEAMGVAPRRIVLLGFSQGACIACKYVWRHPRRWGGLIAFTGGLFGPEGSRWPGPHLLDRTPILLTNSDQDDWVPWSRVEETAGVFKRMGAEVTLRLYPGRDHIVGDEEIEEARAMLQRAIREPEALPAFEEEL